MVTDLRTCSLAEVLEPPWDTDSQIFVYSSVLPPVLQRPQGPEWLARIICWVGLRESLSEDEIAQLEKTMPVIGTPIGPRECAREILEWLRPLLPPDSVIPDYLPYLP